MQLYIRTIRPTDAVVQALDLGLEPVVIAEAAAVNEGPALALGLVERPLVHVLRAGSVLRFDEAPVRQVDPWPLRLLRRRQGRRRRAGQLLQRRRRRGCR